MNANTPEDVKVAIEVQMNRKKKHPPVFPKFTNGVYATLHNTMLCFPSDTLRELHREAVVIFTAHPNALLEIAFSAGPPRYMRAADVELISRYLSDPEKIETHAAYWESKF